MKPGKCFVLFLCWCCVSLTAFADLESAMRETEMLSKRSNALGDRARRMIDNQDVKGMELLFKNLNCSDPAVQADCYDFVASGQWMPPKYARLASDCLLASQNRRYILEALDVIERDYPYICCDKEEKLIRKLRKNEDAEIRKQAKWTLKAIECSKWIDRNYFPFDGPWKHNK